MELFFWNIQRQGVYLVGQFGSLRILIFFLYEIPDPRVWRNLKARTEQRLIGMVASIYSVSFPLFLQQVINLFGTL